MTTWFTSDTHFRHRNILKYTNRPFTNIDDMDEAIIANWNNVIKPKDEIWHLGDFALQQKSTELEPIFNRLNGIKHLIKGNHDSNQVFRLNWASQNDYRELKLDGKHVILFHYAIVGWNRSNYGSIHLHGHHHNTLAPLTNRIDVGVDCWHLTPVTLSDIIPPLNNLTTQGTPCPSKTKNKLIE